MDYTTDYRFWVRLESFVSNVEVNDQMSEEEKQMLLNIAKQKIIELGTTIIG